MREFLSVQAVRDNGKIITIINGKRFEMKFSKEGVLEPIRSMEGYSAYDSPKTIEDLIYDWLRFGIAKAERFNGMSGIVDPLKVSDSVLESISLEILTAIYSKKFNFNLIDPAVKGWVIIVLQEAKRRIGWYSIDFPEEEGGNRYFHGRIDDLLSAILDEHGNLGYVHPFMTTSAYIATIRAQKSQIKPVPSASRSHQGECRDFIAHGKDGPLAPYVRFFQVFLSFFQPSIGSIRKKESTR